jgi:hypothetical protein
MILRRVLVIAALLVGMSHVARAQRAAGVVRDSAMREPIAGAVVSALDSASRAVARSISDAAGRYFVDLPASATQLRVVRIGYQPRTIALPRQRGPVTTTDVAMVKLVTMLSAVVVRDERLCSAEQGAAAVSLWEQARAGLLTAVVARESHPADVTILYYKRIVDVSSGKVADLASSIRAGTSTRPFLADAPTGLAEHGYMQNTADGGQIFAGPDADVLLDDSFAATHCFSVKPADSAHPGAVGLAFDPIRGRDTLIDVAGTLWLESGVPALRSLEFTYTDRNGVLKRNNAGGTMSFHAMPNGVVFIDDWTLRLPAPDTSRNARAGRVGRLVITGLNRVTHMSETGGLVLRATWPDSSHFATSLQPVTGTIVERGTNAPMANVFVALRASGEAFFTDSTGHFSMFPVLPGHYAVDAADTTLAAYLPIRVSSADLDVIGGRVPPVLRFELPGRAAAIGALCKGFDASSASVTLLGRLADSGGTNTIPDDVRIVAEWLQENGGGKHETQTVSVDERGRFSVCGIPRGRTVLLTANHKNVRYADVPVSTGASSIVETMEWTLDYKGLANARPARLASLKGRVLRSTSGGPLPGAEIWFPSLDRRATADSSGAFHVDSLPGGQLLVQIRTLGYGLRRDTVTVAEGRDLLRDFTLSSAATMLDTVKTVASATGRISPSLRSFDARRLSGMGGYFISDSTLREHDGQPLASIIMSRAPGGHLVPGRNGATYMVSARKPCAGSVMSTCTTPNCYVTTYLDGVRIYNAGEGAAPTDLQRIYNSELAGVEFYPNSGTGPAEYNATGSGCGLLLLWTRER